jgi:hypothetical protein
MAWWMVLGFVVVFAAVVGFNAWCDPLGILGSGRYRVVSKPWIDRTYKLELLRTRKDPPDALILGSSTILDVDPAYIRELTGGEVFNAGVSDNSPLDAQLLSGYALDRWKGDPPELLYGLDVGSFVGTSPSAAIIQNPELRGQLPAWDQLQLVSEAYRPLLDLRRVTLSWRTFRAGRSRPLPPLEQLYQPDGRARGTSIGQALAVDDRTAQRKLGIRVQTNATLGQFPALDAREVEAFEHFLQVANDHGIKPTVFLPPIEPSRLDRKHLSGADHRYWSDWNDRHDDVIRLLRRESKVHQLRWYDLTDVREIGGSRQSFHDYLHMDVAAVRQMLDHLQQIGALTPEKLTKK